MTTRVLGALQVAALLVSASYGIGFLFGSGEMALSQGMAGGLYGVATALGMFALATFAGRLWKLGVPVWELFGQAFGQRIQRAVAMLSLVWMSGVLAAQITGGVAIAQVAGLPGYLSHALVLALILGASRLDLRVASRLFAACLLASALVLFYALADAGGLALYTQAALELIEAMGDDVLEKDVVRLSPLKWSHIQLLGRYDFTMSPDVTGGDLRPLRDPNAFIGLEDEF